MKSLESYLKYGISSELAQKLNSRNLSISNIKTLSVKILISQYGLELDEVKSLKKLLVRQPIPEDTVIDLLENSSFVCCVCHGVKSTSYVIHHIEPYCKSRDNSYSNLAVLCPADHDLAHREGHGLTLKLTQMQIRHAKQRWEKMVRRNDEIQACFDGEFSHIEYCNIERIYDLCIQVHGMIPEVSLTHKLKEIGLLTTSGYVNDTLLNERYPSRTVSPLNFFAPGGGAFLREYFFQLFKTVLQYKNLEDLDSLLNKTAVITGNLVGKMCIYIGGIYGKSPKYPITNESRPVKMYLRRKPFYVTWIIDPRLMTSSTSIFRIGGHNVHFIYGSIRSVDTVEIKGEKFIHYDIRPYIMGCPSRYYGRRPDISYLNDDINFSDFFDDEE